MEELFEYCHDSEKKFYVRFRIYESIFSTISFLRYDTKCMYHPYNTFLQY